MQNKIKKRRARLKLLQVRSRPKEWKNFILIELEN